MSVQSGRSTRALHEIDTFGFNGFWHPAMKTFVQDFPRGSLPPAYAALPGY